MLDVNYGGSTGYGRDYRRRLRGQWGVVDIDDVCAGAEYLVAKGLACKGKLAIDGGSAGGYTTLGALAFKDVFSAGCSNCPNSVNTYDHSASANYKADGASFTIAYVDGDTVSGYLSKDKMEWGGLSFSRQTFAEIDSAATFSIVCQEDGLLGMACDDIASSEATTPFHNLIKKGLVDKDRFSFYLSHDDGTDDYGVLTLGGSDATYYTGDMVWFNLAKKSYRDWYPYYFTDDW